MYSSVQRADCYKSKLILFLKQKYNIIPLSIAAAKRGFYGETWKIATADKSYFCKLVYAAAHKQTYKNSFSIVNYLLANNLEFIPKLIKTKSGELFTDFDNAIMGVFEWIDGENVQNEITKKAEYHMLSRVYSIDCSNINIAKENFNECGYAEFYDRLKSINCDELNALFDNIKDRITYRAERLHIFSKRCKNDALHFYITHGDAGGNIIQNKNSFYLIDWDNPKLAPPERDAWFCMGWSWAVEMFEQNLAAVGIKYKLNSDRLAYYAYYYFYYLNEYLKAYQELTDKRTELLNAIEDFSTGWIEESFFVADKIE